MVPSDLPESVREDADTYRKDLAAAETERLRRRTATTRSAASCATTGTRTARREKERAGCASRPSGRVRSRPGGAASETKLIALYKRMGGCWRSAQDDPQAHHPRHRRRALLQRHDPHRRAARGVQLHARVPERFPGVVVEERYLRRYPDSGSPRSCSGRVRDRPGAAQGGRVRGRRAGHADRPERARGRPTTSTCAAPTATRRSSSTRSAAATTSARRRSRSPSRASGSS